MRRVGLILAILCSMGGAPACAQSFNVFAAASLREAGWELKWAFERRYPQVNVVLNYAGSQVLAAQIKEGAPCDVFLSAGEGPLKGLSYDESSYRIFAQNHLVLVVPDDSKLRDFVDLAKAKRLVIADRKVPVGDYTLKMLDKAAKQFGAAWKSKVLGAVVSREQDVRAVLSKVILGEADAGIVYESDTMADAGRLMNVKIPDKMNVEAYYPVVRFSNSDNADMARNFVRFLFDREAQGILVNHRFESPLFPARAVGLTIGGQVTWLNTSAITKLELKTFTANQNGKDRKLKGFDLKPLLAKVRGVMIQLVGADGYRQTVRLNTTVQNGAYLAPIGDDNYELILPQQPQTTWIRWIRDITIQ